MKKSKRLLANLHDKTQYVIRIRNSKRASSHRLVLKKLHRILKFKQKAWLKSYIDLRKKAKSDFEKYFFELMNNAVFGKTIENMRKHEDTKLVTTGKRTNYLVPETNYHATKFFTDILLYIEIKITQKYINKPVYLELPTLELSKMSVYEFWYNYVKTKYSEKAKFCYMDTNSFIIYIKADDIYKDITKDVKIKLLMEKIWQFHTSIKQIFYVVYSLYCYILLYIY